MRRNLPFLFLLLLPALVMATDVDYKSGVTNTDVNLTNGTVTNLLLSDAVKLVVNPSVSYMLHINEISFPTYSTKPQTIFNSTVIEATVFHSFKIDIDYNSSANFSLEADISAIDYSTILKPSLHWFYFNGVDWEQTGTYSADPRPSTKLVFVGFNPTITTQVINVTSCDQSLSFCQNTYSCFTNASYANTLDDLNDSLQNKKEDLADCEGDLDDKDDEARDYRVQWQNCLGRTTLCDYNKNCPKQVDCNYATNCPKVLTYAEMCGSNNISLSCPECPQINYSVLVSETPKTFNSSKSDGLEMPSFKAWIVIAVGLFLFYTFFIKKKISKPKKEVPKKEEKLEEKKEKDIWKSFQWK